MIKSIGITAILLLISCYQNPYFDPTQKHHTREGFQNISPSPDKSWKDMKRWLKQRKTGTTKVPERPKK